MEGKDCNHLGQNRCEVCAPVLDGLSGAEKQQLLERALAAIRGVEPPVLVDQRPRIVRILMDRWEEHGISHSDAEALATTGIDALQYWQRYLAQGGAASAWTFPHEWHATATVGGLRESGPA